MGKLSAIYTAIATTHKHLDVSIVRGLRECLDMAMHSLALWIKSKVAASLYVHQILRSHSVTVW